MNTLQLRKIVVAFLLLPSFQADALTLKTKLNLLNAYARAYNVVVSARTGIQEKVQHLYKNQEKNIEKLKQQAKTKVFKIVASGTAGVLLTAGVALEIFHRNRVATKFRDKFGNRNYFSHTSMSTILKKDAAAEKNNLQGEVKAGYVAAGVFRASLSLWQKLFLTPQQEFNGISCCRDDLDKLGLYPRSQDLMD